MSQVDQLKSTIEALSPAEFVELRTWLANTDWQRWDEQLEKDVKAAKREFLREVATPRVIEPNSHSVQLSFEHYLG